MKSFLAARMRGDILLEEIHMRIDRHTYTSSNMTRFLAKCNSMHVGRDFARKMVEVAELDHGIHLYAIDDETTLVTSPHMGFRNSLRGEGPRQHLEARIASLLNQVVVEALRRYPVMWDEGMQAAVPMEEDETGCGIIATALIDEAKHMVYVLEIGWDYVYVVTVLDYGLYLGCGNSDGVITMHRGTALIRIDENGFTHIDEGGDYVLMETPEQEIRRMAKKAGKH